MDLYDGEDQTTGKIDNHTVKLCPASHGTSGEGTVRTVNSVFHYNFGQGLSSAYCAASLCEDKVFFGVFTYIE